VLFLIFYFLFYTIFEFLITCTVNRILQLAPRLKFAAETERMLQRTDIKLMRDIIGYVVKLT